MIRRLFTAALDAGTLSRTVLVLSRQLDNAHLLAASEEARADRAELRVAELEHQIDDWREASAELAAEQPAADALPDLTDAGETPIPLVLTDSAREADIQRDRADALFTSLRACEVDLVNERARADAQEARANQAEIERDAAARSAGAHLRTIERLRADLVAAHRAVHRPAPLPPLPVLDPAIVPVLQIPGVEAAPEIEPAPETKPSERTTAAATEDRT